MSHHQPARCQCITQMDQSAGQIIHRVKQAHHHNQIEAGVRVGRFKVDIRRAFRCRPA